MSSSQIPSSTPAADHQESLEKFKQWGQGVLLLIAAVFLGVSLFNWNRSRTEGLLQDIYLAYSTAFTPEALAQVVEAYPDAPEAALARIQMGGMYFRDGEYAEALAVYEDFLQTRPRHPLVEEVRFSRLMALEAMGKLDEALAGFSQVSGEQLMFPQALFAVARIHEKQGRPDLALPMYQRIEEDFEDSVWAFQAGMFRQAAERAARTGSVTESVEAD